MSEVKQYALQESQEPLEIRVYPGADADFYLYNDEGDGYNYEKGEYSIIPIHWSEKAGVLTFGEISGRYEGMKDSLFFNVVFVNNKRGAGIETSQIDRLVTYHSERVTLKIQ